MDNTTHRPSLADHLDTVQSGIGDAYEALCALADAGNIRASVLRDALRVAFAVGTVSVPCAMPFPMPAFPSIRPGVETPLQAFTTRTVVGAVDAMREQPERDFGPLGFDMDAEEVA